MSERIKIRMTNRAPVTVLDEEWPVLARAEGDSYAGNDGGRHSQALIQGELDEYMISIRAHADGRCIVYGDISGSIWTGTEHNYAGEILESFADMVAALVRVGSDAGVPDVLVRECIAALPAEEM